MGRGVFRLHSNTTAATEPQLAESSSFGAENGGQGQGHGAPCARIRSSGNGRGRVHLEVELDALLDVHSRLLSSPSRLKLRVLGAPA
jgi:hypothetical protein